MSDIGRIMKKTKSNMAKLTSSAFGTGSFVYMEEKVPGKSKIRRVFYVSEPVKQKEIEENKAADVATIGAANKLMKRFSPKLEPFDKGSALCSGFIQKSQDQKTLLLRIATSKGCSEAKLKRGLKELEKEHKGNAFTKLIRYKAGFKAGDAMVESKERKETLERRKQTKEMTKKAPKDPTLRSEFYDALIGKMEADVRKNVQRAMEAQKDRVALKKDKYLDLRDKLEEASVYLRKYEQAAEKIKLKSKHTDLYKACEDAHARLSELLVDDQSEMEKMSKSGKDMKEKLKDKALDATGIKDSMEAGGNLSKGNYKDAANNAADAILKAEAKAMQATKTVSKMTGDSATEELASEVAGGLNLALGVKKTVEAGVRISRAAEAKETIRARFEEESKAVEKQRVVLDMQRPDPKEDSDAYNAWVKKKMRLTSQVDAMEHLVEIQNSIQKKSAFDVLENSLSIASGALALSGVGGVAGAAVSGTKYGLKGAKMAGEKYRDSKRDSKSEKRKTLIGKDAAHRMMSSTKKSTEKAKRRSSFSEKRIQNSQLKERDRKILEEMNEIRNLRSKSIRGEELSRREEWKLGTAVNEDASKGMQLMRKSDTARAIITADPETQAMMLKCIGIQEEEWTQLKDAAKERLAEWSDDSEPIKESDKAFKRMLAEMLSVTIPNI